MIGNVEEVEEVSQPMNPMDQNIDQPNNISENQSKETQPIFSELDDDLPELEF